MLTNSQILRIAMEQHAIDANCSADDFVSSENVVVISKPHENARRYLNLPFFCDIISYGNNIVASVDQRVYEYVKKYIVTTPHMCFEPTQTWHMAKEFAKYGYSPCFQAQYWLPDVEILQPLPCKYELRVLEQQDFADLYLPQWGHALSPTRPHLDMLGVGAYEGGKLVGLSACSADCDTMWQIGIDVLPEYRKQGIATALTSRLAVEILERGKVPFYCCAWANISSSRNAIKSGFRPAWVEYTAVQTEKMLEYMVNKKLMEWE